MGAALKTRAAAAAAADTAPAREITPFGQLIRQFRKARDISQAALARDAGLSPGYVGLIETGERGERPSLDICKKFAQGLNLSVPETEELLRAAGHLRRDEALIQDDKPSFAAFVNLDARLTKTQKDMLIGLYESWLGINSAREASR